jgi:hypothetical protein
LVDFGIRGMARADQGYAQCLQVEDAGATQRQHETKGQPYLREMPTAHNFREQSGTVWLAYEKRRDIEAGSGTVDMPSPWVVQFLRVMRPGDSGQGHPWGVV